MHIHTANSSDQAGELAAAAGATHIRHALQTRGEARVIIATGASQFTMLKALVTAKDIDWSRCTVFHLDEYIGLSPKHPASFVNYLNQRFVSLLPQLHHFEPINGEASNTEAEMSRLGKLLAQSPIDVAFVGIGENSHLAFNDPPADFHTTDAYLRVSLDQACRQQQVNEGWFDTLDDVPQEAISMSIRQIMAARSIICTVPDKRKAIAVRDTVQGPVSNLCPASILQEHADTNLFLDPDSASLLDPPHASA